jgi:hypothetical protein
LPLNYPIISPFTFIVTAYKQNNDHIFVNKRSFYDGKNK